MKLKDFNISNRNIYKIARGIKNTIEKEDSNTVENVTELLSTLNREELVEYILWMAKYNKMEEEYYKVGDKYYKSRYDVEQIYHCNATAFYPSISEKEKILRDDEIYNKIEREYFYYYDDSGKVYRSYVETLVGVPHKHNPELPTYMSEVVSKDDEVLVEIVGVIPTHTNKIDLVFGIQ